MDTPEKPCLPAPDPWLAAHGALLRAAAPSPVLDVACGKGRNALWLAAAGIPVLGVDLSPGAVERARKAANHRGLPARFAVWNVERNGLPSGPWGAVIVFHFLDRPLFGRISGVLRPGGFLVAKTHMAHPLRPPGARPHNPAYLLGPGELLRLCAGLEPLRYAEWAGAHGAFAALVARKPRPGPYSS